MGRPVYDNDDETLGMLQTEEGAAAFMTNAIEAALEEDEVDDVSTCSFRDAGLLTRDHGFVLKVGDVEFQVTVKRSR